MKAVILAGGLGTRISEESHLKPKPMIEIGGKPILWHIMKIFTYYGIRDFVICCGYKGYVIKEYFANYLLHMSDVSIDVSTNKMEVHHAHAEPWKVTLIDTGKDTMTGGRLKRAQKYIDDKTFCFTYGDGVSDVNIYELIDYHQKHDKVATVTAIQPPGRYGSLEINDGFVARFQEKPLGDGAWVNGGFFVLNSEVFNFISDDSIIWEQEPLEKLALSGELKVYQHHGFWQAMDTLRDKVRLEELWNSNNAPWKVW